MSITLIFISYFLVQYVSSFFCLQGKADVYVALFLDTLFLPVSKC